MRKLRSRLVLSLPLVYFMVDRGGNQMVWRIKDWCLSLERMRSWVDWFWIPCGALVKEGI